jgi:type II secretory pathway pseudopilin PulG
MYAVRCLPATITTVMRYRLRTLLICLSLLSVLCAGAGWSWRRNSAEQKAVQTLIAHRARVEFSDGVRLAGLEAWVDARLGREFRSDVETVRVDNFDANDPDVVAALRRLPALRHVRVECWPGMHAAGEKLKSDLQDTDVEVQVDHLVW